MRLLDPVLGKDDPTENVKGLGRRSREAAAAQLSARCAASLLSALPEEQIAHACTELEAICQEAAELSWNMWTRKSRIEVLGWNALALADSQAAKAYSSESEIFALHPLNNKDVDEDSTALDGHMPVLVCSPLIASFGNADGKDYGQRTVIKKAVVWMGEPFPFEDWEVNVDGLGA